MSNQRRGISSDLELGRSHSDDPVSNVLDVSCSDASAASGALSTAHSATTSKEEGRIMIANNEDRAIKYLRLILLLILVVVAAGCSYAVFWYTHSSEQENFERMYLDQASKLVDAFRSNANRRLRAVESFAIAISSNAESQGMQWPMVTIDDYGKFQRRI